MVVVGDLVDQIGMVGPRPLLYCWQCGAECSANAGDYWDAPKDVPLLCCGQLMQLVTKRVIYEEVQP